MKEEKVFTTAIAEFYIHDRHDKVLTGSFHHLPCTYDYMLLIIF